ncbi:MAG: hypothetical protein LC099_10900 [Anaerolineales bacterium]|nr:hypothetical protein [Anaerolineales bacterium]
MNTRQAVQKLTSFALLLGLCACAAANEIPPTATATRLPAATSTSIPTATFTPSPLPPAPTETPPACRNEAGQVKEDLVSTTNPQQPFLIYLPPCYEDSAEARYPVLYLLHGQTYTDDQWIRLGVPQAADEMIHSQKSVPFIIIFPDDSLWNLQAGWRFGERLINALIPYADEKYRTIPDRAYRAVGGLSRGGGWAAELGLQNPNLFGAIGLHSPAIFKGDGTMLRNLVKNIPDDSRPRLWIDVGDVDREWKSVFEFEEDLVALDHPHEFRVYLGDHSEAYWGEHVREYLEWYAAGWDEEKTP